MSDSSANSEKWLKINLKVKEKWIIETFQLLREHKIEPILIKGRAVSEFYPQKHQRQFIDIDICVASDKYKKAKNILTNKPFSYGAVDLHDGLRELDLLDWDDLFENSIFLEIDGYKIRVLRPEDHLRVLAVHWLIDGGEYKERLYDIYWLVKNRPENFDWERCLDVVPENRRRWLTCVIGIAHKYLKLPIDDLPFQKELRYIPKWMIKTIEKEWQSDVRIIPINTVTGDKKMLIRQILKRFPPNPITATVMVEGNFDSKTRLFYQIENFYRRLIPFITSRN